MPQKRTSYFYNPSFGTYYFGLNHPMKPFRAAMVQELMLANGLDEHLNLFEPRDARFEEIALFHAPEYIRFLKTITPETTSKFTRDC